MRYAISDIHGEYELFVRLMDKIAFSSSDELFVCGDITDKGEDGIRLLQLIFSMPNVHCILGNHEYAFLKYYWALMRSSPEDFSEVLSRLRGYFPPPDGDLLDWDTVDRTENLPLYIEEEDFICVHAGLPTDDSCRIVPPQSVKPEFLVNDRTFKEPHVLPRDGKCVFFGHTPARYVCGEDRIIPYVRKDMSGERIADYCKVHLDTGVYLSGVLGCFCIDTCRPIYVKKY